MNIVNFIQQINKGLYGSLREQVSNIGACLVASQRIRIITTVPVRIIGLDRRRNDSSSMSWYETIDEGYRESGEHGG